MPLVLIAESRIDPHTHYAHHAACTIIEVSEYDGCSKESRLARVSAPTKCGSLHVDFLLIFVPYSVPREHLPEDAG